MTQKEPNGTARKESVVTTCSTQAVGVVAALAAVAWTFRKRTLQLLGIAWVLAAFVWFFCFRHFYLQGRLPLCFSWFWHTPPAWVDLVHRGWNGIPWVVVIQGGLLIWIAAVTAILGWRLMRALGVCSAGFSPSGLGANRLGGVVWGGGLVLGALAMLVFAIGVLGGLTHARAVFGATLVASSLMAVWILWRAGKQAGDWRLEAGGTETKKPTAYSLQPAVSKEPTAYSLQPKASPFSRAEWWMMAGMAALQFLTLLYTLTPEIQSDALRYHLAAPQEWLKRGRLSYLPYNAFSNFPSNVEMLFLFGLGLAGDLLAKGFHFLFLPLTTGAVALITHEILESARTTAGTGGGSALTMDVARGSDSDVIPTPQSPIRNPQSPIPNPQSAIPPPWWHVRPALLAAGAWGTLPITIPLAGWGFIDLGLTYFTLGLLYFLLCWARTGRTRDWILAAVFGGLLCGSKYTGVVTVFWSALLVVPLGFYRLKLERQAGGLGLETGGTKTEEPTAYSLQPTASKWNVPIAAVLFGVVAAAVASPWWIKNYIYTGNPVYPMAWNLFGGGEWSKDLARFYFEKTQEKGILAGPHVSWEILLNTIRLPWTTAHYPETFEGFEIGPLFWVFCPWILVWTACNLKPKAHGLQPLALSLWMLCFCLFWFFSYQSNRFFLPGWALGTVIIAVALAEAGRWNTAVRALCLIGFLLPVLYGGLDSARWLLFDTGKLQFEKTADGAIAVKSGTTWPAYTLGYLTRQDYLALHLNYARGAEYCNARLRPTDKVLLVGEHRKMHWRCRVEGNDWFDAPRILPYLNQAKDVAQLLDILLADGFTHIFFNLDEWGWPGTPSSAGGEPPPVPAGSAWHYNRRHFSRANIALLQDLLASNRLKKLQPLNPERIYVARILPRPNP